MHSRMKRAILNIVVFSHVNIRQAPVFSTMLHELGCILRLIVGPCLQTSCECQSSRTPFRTLQHVRTTAGTAPAVAPRMPPWHQLKQARRVVQPVPRSQLSVHSIASTLSRMFCTYCLRYRWLNSLILWEKYMMSALRNARV
jgi:molybdenum cofactor biosynthesis enzyme MoaA